MTHLSKYIVREIWRPLVAAALILSAVVWLTQSLQMLDLIINRGQSLGTFMMMTLFVFPSLLTIILPFALFCAVLYTLNRLTTDSEIAVMWSAGASNWEIARPVTLVAVGVALITLAINLYFMPAGYRSMKDKAYQIRTDIASTLIKDGTFSHPKKGVTIFTGDSNSNGEFKSLFFYDARETNSPVAYTAKLGRLVQSAQGPRLILVDGRILPSDADGSDDKLTFQKYVLDLSDMSEADGAVLRETTERYLHELLWPDLSRSWDQQNRLQLWAEGHNRITSPLYNLTFALIALVAFLTGPSNRRGRPLRISAAISAGLLVRLSGLYLQSLASQNAIFIYFQYAVPIVVIIVCAYLLVGKGLTSTPLSRRVQPPPDLTTRGAATHA